MVPASFAPFAFAGESLALGASGAVWWPRAEALLVADLHLEKASWYAQRGQMLPPYDSRATLERLARDSAATGARRIVALGDSFHDRDGPSRLEAGAGALLARIAETAGILWVAGNHDAASPADTAIGTCHGEITLHGIHLRHEAHPYESQPEISGHFHPKIAVVARGRRISRPCLLLTPNRIILPAYGAFTGGLSAHDPAIHASLGNAAPVEALLHVAGRIARFPAAPAAEKRRTG